MKSEGRFKDADSLARHQFCMAKAGLKALSNLKPPPLPLGGLQTSDPGSNFQREGSKLPVPPACNATAIPTLPALLSPSVVLYILLPRDRASVSGSLSSASYPSLRLPTLAPQPARQRMYMIPISSTRDTEPSSNYFKRKTKGLLYSWRFNTARVQNRSGGRGSGA